MRCFKDSLSIILFGMLTSATVAGDWPQMLGPNRNGISTETNLIDAFPADGPKVQWRVPGGVGMSGVVVSGKVACTLVQDEQSQSALLLNAVTGETLWKQEIVPAYKNGMGNGPRATPTIAQTSIYAFTGEGVLAALALTNGEVLWRVDTVSELGGKIAEYGMACSPVVTNDSVIVTVGSPKATVAAYDRVTGKLRWTAGEGLAAGYSSPAILKLNGTDQLVVHSGAAVLGIDPVSGKELWAYPFVTDYSCNIATPIAIDGNVFISSGENHGSALLSVPQQAGGDVTEVWTSFGNRSDMRNEWQTSILHEGLLYGFDNIGSAGPISDLACINAKDGTPVWSKKRFGKGNLTAADGKLWISMMSGELLIVKVSPTGFEELGRVELMGQTRQAPALSNGRLFLRDDAEIVCVDIRKSL